MDQALAGLGERVNADLALYRGGSLVALSAPVLGDLGIIPPLMDPGAFQTLALEGAKIVEAFDRNFAFVGVQGLGGRESLLMTGTAEIKESAERAAVFAVLDATNRWTEARRPG